MWSAGSCELRYLILLIRSNLVCEGETLDGIPIRWIGVTCSVKAVVIEIIIIWKGNSQTSTLDRHLNHSLRLRLLLFRTYDLPGKTIEGSGNAMNHWNINIVQLRFCSLNERYSSDVVHPDSKEMWNLNLGPLMNELIRTFQLMKGGSFRNKFILIFSSDRLHRRSHSN